MSVVSKEGKFIINGKEVFLFGGECHYYRVPKEEWANRLDSLIEAGCNLVSTYVPWVWHEFEEGIFDFTGDTRPERDLKSFLQLVKEKKLYCIVRPGPYVMAEVRYEGIPPWLLSDYPDVIAKQRNGLEHPTKVVSYQHPIFLEKVQKWYEQVNTIIAPMQLEFEGPIIMYQLCNEIGMLHWVTNTSDFNAPTLKQFEMYMLDKYKTVDSINQVYGIEEHSIKSFVDSFSKDSNVDAASLHYEWGEFWRVYIKDYVGHLRQFAKNTGISVPFIINVHGFKDYSIYSRGVDYPIGLSQLYKTAEFDDVILAGDFYPGRIGYDNYHDLVLASAYTKAISNQDQPLFSAEFQSGRLADRPRLYPQDLDLNTRTCVAHGMNALNYYMFVAGENYENIGLFGTRHEWQAPIDSQGNPRPSYFKAKHLGKMFETVGEKLVHAKKQIHTFVGFNPDDYMTETIDERDRHLVDEIAGKRENYSFDGIVRLLVAANIQFEAIDLLKALNPGVIPSIWVFSTQYMKKDLQEKLVHYVKNGGKLILYPQIPIKDLTGKPCTILCDELELGEWDVHEGVTALDVLTIPSVMARQRLSFSKFNGEPIAYYNGETAAYKKKAGNGEILVFGLGIGHDYQYKLEVILAVANQIGVTRHLSSDNSDLSLVERKNNQESFVFISNYDDIEQHGAVFSHDHALFDGKVVKLPPRSSLLALQNYQVHEDVTIVYSTLELISLKNSGGTTEIRLVPIGKDAFIKVQLQGKTVIEYKGSIYNEKFIELDHLNEEVLLLLKNENALVKN
ncbi:beta-galactosidase [Bacillus sp. PAMC26568]|nr:beta-galactosidase [Bacillus sp. PAMC26568]